MRKIFSLIGLTSSIMLLAGALLPPLVSAAAPECYTQAVGGQAAAPVRTATCGQLFRQQVGHALRDDTCYLLVNLAGTPTIYDVERNDPLCQEWRFFATAPLQGPQNPGQGSLANPTRNTSQSCNGGRCVNSNYLVVMAKWAINLLSAAVGIVVTIVVIFAGIEYSASNGDPSKTAAAKSRIINAMIALIAYMFLYVALQWLIPGGLFA